MAKSIESLYNVAVYDIEDYKKVLDLALQQANEIERNLWVYEYSQNAVDKIRELIYEFRHEESLEYYFEYLMKNHDGNLYYLMQEFIDTQTTLGSGMFLDYYSRAFKYLEDNGIYDFSEAIDDWGAKSVNEIAYYYYYLDLMRILDSIEIEYEFDE